MKFYVPVVIQALIGLALAATPGLQANAADPVQQAIDTVVDTHQGNARSQQRINQLDDESRQLLEQYRLVTRQTETLEIYNQQLQRLLESQTAEINSLARQIQEIEVTQQEITPLMLRMVNTLEQFVRLDVPFLPEERQQRLHNLRATLDRADVSVSEKFRQILEAYQVENDYGRTIEAYRSELTLHSHKGKSKSNDKSRTVDFLRIGRVALFYQTLDGLELGVWNKAQQQWQPLEDDYRAEINQGIRIARKQTAPDLVVLPVAAPQQGQIQVMEAQP